MTLDRSKFFIFRQTLFISLCALSLFATISCTTQQSKAHQAIEKYLKDRGATEVQSDFFYTDANFKGKAYSSVTATFSYADAKGNPQQEFLGFILNKEGDDWKVEKQTSYTTESAQAALFLAGKKK